MFHVFEYYQFGKRYVSARQRDRCLLVIWRLPWMVGLYVFRLTSGKHGDLRIVQQSWCNLRLQRHRMRCLNPAPLRTVNRFLTLLACTLILVGCSGDTRTREAGATSQSIPNDWDVTEEELRFAYEREMAYEAEQSNIQDPPEVEIVRFTTSTEWPLAQQQCLSENGFEAEVSQGGISLALVPDDQRESLNMAVYICKASYPIDPRANMPLPRIRAEMQYEHLRTTVNECVESLGYSVEPPPSMETWLAGYYAGESVWDPFDNVVSERGRTDIEALDEVYAACPHEAPGLYPPLDTE